MIARVLTVKSTTDWKVRTGGRRSEACRRARHARCGPAAPPSGGSDWRAPLTGKELYLNGLNSGRMPSHAALAKAGSSAGSAAMPAKRAKLVMPIIGEIRMRRSGRASCLSSSASRAYFIASAPPLEKPTMCSGFDGPARRLRLAHGEARGRIPVLPFDVGQGGRNGAMGRHPDRHGDKAVVAIAARDVAQAVGRIGEPVQQDDRADRRPVGLEDVGAVPVLREVAGIDRAAVVVAVARDAGLGVELVGDFGPHAAEDRLFGLEPGRPVGLVDLGGVHVVRHVGVPRLERPVRAANPRRARPEESPRPRSAAPARA